MENSNTPSNVTGPKKKFIHERHLFWAICRQLVHRLLLCVGISLYKNSPSHISLESDLHKTCPHSERHTTFHIQHCLTLEQFVELYPFQIFCFICQHGTENNGFWFERHLMCKHTLQHSEKHSERNEFSELC